MLLYNNKNLSQKVKRDIKTIKFEIEETPERPIYAFRNTKERNTFISTIVALVRRSDEYKEWMKFLKVNLDMSRCTVLRNLVSGNGKRYTIEIHHEPFSLREIVDIILTKFEFLGETLNPFLIADEVMELHYDEKVGLVPLSKTMHELVENDKIFIPLQLIYQGYDKFYEEYEPYISDKIKEKIQMKVNLSLKTDGEILSDIVDTEFIYVEIDGFNFPEVPKEWGDIMKSS